MKWRTLVNYINNLEIGTEFYENEIKKDPKFKEIHNEKNKYFGGLLNINLILLTISNCIEYRGYSDIIYGHKYIKLKNIPKEFTKKKANQIGNSYHGQGWKLWFIAPELYE